MPKRKTIPAAELYRRRKRRVMGELLQEAAAKSDSARLQIHRSSKSDLITYESEGLVVSVNGSGSLAVDHPQAQEAARLADHIRAVGGIVMSGGRNSGIMEAVAKTTGASSVGIIFPELSKESTTSGQHAIVNSPHPRVELLATCCPIVVAFRGGLGTMMVLLRAIVHFRNRQFSPEQPVQMIFVSNYWIGLLTTMMNIGALPKEFLSELYYFDRVDEIIKRLPSFVD